MLRKLLKWLLALVAVVVAAALVFVWGVLGVSPLEGRQDHLWELVSNEVDFFARWPGTQLVHEPLPRALAQEPGYDWLAEAREQLAELSRQIAREANPQIPLGLVEVEFEKDFLRKEMALAGAIRGNYADPRPDNFIFLTRIAGYGRFVSALKRDFVRERVGPLGQRIEVVKGLYFKLKLTAEEAQQVARFRSGKARVEPNALWFGRIRDVLLVSDAPEWIEAALLRGSETLPADTYFQTEFIPYSVRPGDAELLIRPTLAQMMMYQHGREDLPGPLPLVARFVPSHMCGDVTLQATPRPDAISLRLNVNPPDQGFAKVTKAHVVKLYERQKADLRLDFSEEGIGRFIPKDRTVAAFVIHCDAETLVGFILDFIPRDVLVNLDDQARLSLQERGQGFRDFRGLLAELTKDLEDTHMVVVHRPAAFEGADYSSLDDRMDTPMAQLAFTLVSRVKDTAVPDRTRETVTRNLRYLGLKPPEDADGRPLPNVHPRGFYLAEPLIAADNWSLVKPAYGAMPGGTKYFFFSTSPEAAEACFRAAEDANRRLVADATVRGVTARLPREGTLGLLLRGAAARDALWDRVRLAADQYLDVINKYEVWYAEYKRMGKSEDEIDRLMADDAARYLATEYPDFRDRYERAIAPLRLLDTAVVGATLGVGPTKQVRAEGYLHFDVEGEGAGTGADDAAPAGEE